MEIGIFARTFAGSRVEPMLDAAIAHGLRHIHFNLKCAGVPSLPEVIDPALCQSVCEAFQQRNMKMVAISGTFNMIDPDVERRREQTGRALQLIRCCGRLGTNVVSLCTGSRNATDMWQHHPDNASSDAWRDLIETLEAILPTAESDGVTLGIEPEVANVIDTAKKARRLLDQIRSPAVKIIVDPANLFWPDKLDAMTSTLEEAFDLLGNDIIMAHAKDITGDAAKKQQAAGTGQLDWATYFRLLKQSGFDGPIILHNLTPEQVDAAVGFVCRQAAPWYPELASRAEL